MRKRADGTKVYGITYTNPAGRTIRKIVGPAPGVNIEMARAALATVQADKARGAFNLAPVLRSPLFRIFATQYLDHARTEKKSWQLDRECLKPLTAHFGARHLDKVTPWFVEQYKAKRLERVSPRTVNIELSILRRMYRLARTWGLAGESPLEDVRNLREEEKSIRVLSTEEEARLFAQLPPHLRELMVLALNTGLRLGELRALKPADADMKNDALRVAQSKTGKSRHVPLNAEARAVIERGLEAGHSTILHYQGRPVREIHRSWYKAVRKAGLVGLRIHDLRHTFATRLVLNGVDLATVAALLGHQSIQMTMRYAHPSPDSKRAAVAKLDAHPLPMKSKRATRRRGARS
jgi:integrase